ncbi:hypothetical protein S40288_08833 [Stachybotrys chartarum IBT 40288]|nr:hypothetical protein S40288_08833 [Stachybotrys chartarum IBT 40288]
MAADSPHAFIEELWAGISLPYRPNAADDALLVLQQDNLVGSLMGHYLHSVANTLQPVLHPRNAYSSIYGSKAMSIAKRISWNDIMQRMRVSNSKIALLYSLLTSSSFQIRGFNRSDDADAVARYFHVKAVSHLRLALDSLHHTGEGPNLIITPRFLAKCEGVLAVMLTLVTADVLGGQMNVFWIHLEAAEELVQQLRGQAQPESTAEHLVNIASFLRILSDSTDVTLPALPWSADSADSLQALLFLGGGQSLEYTSDDITSLLASKHILAFAEGIKIYYHKRVAACDETMMLSYVQSVATHLAGIEVIKRRTGYDATPTATISWPGFVASCQASPSEWGAWTKWWNQMLDYRIGNIHDLWLVIQERKPDAYLHALLTLVCSPSSSPSSSCNRILSISAEPLNFTRSSEMVQHVSRAAGLQTFIDAIEQDGCVVIKDFTDLASLEEASKEVQPYLDASVAEAGSTVGALNGGTATCTRLVGRSRTVREKFFSDSLYQDLANYFIGLETTVWYGGEPKVQKSDPLLSISITMSSQPGSNSQKLHRDDKNHHAKHTEASKYVKGRDMLFGLFVSDCDTFEANGATQIVPGSHLWGDGQPDFGPDGNKGVENAELKKGEAFVMLGSPYHGAGKYSLPTGCLSETWGYWRVNRHTTSRRARYGLFEAELGISW